MASGCRRAAAAADGEGRIIARLYSRTGEDISKSFPDLTEALQIAGVIDGELLIVREDRVQSFNVLQQRLNRKAVTPKLLLEYPAHLRAYDLLFDGADDLRNTAAPPSGARGFESFIGRLNDPRIDISPLVAFDGWSDPCGSACRSRRGGGRR